MVKMTERENFLRMLRGEEPAFVSYRPALFQVVLPEIGDRAPGYGNGKDRFGVSWVEDENIKGTNMIDHNVAPVLSDIEDWEDVVRFPNLAEVDWDAIATKTQKDPDKLFYVMMLSGMFERLHDLMDFEEALIAMMTEEDATEAFFERMADYKIECMTYIKKYLDADVIHFQDDYDSQNDLFFSSDIWHEQLKNPLKRCIDACHDLGMVFCMHSCGKVDRIIGDMVDLGIDMVTLAQPVNDFDAWNAEIAGKVFEYAYVDGRTFYSDEYAEDTEMFKRALIERNGADWAVPWGK